MAQQVQVILVDDIDGGGADVTVAFSEPSEVPESLRALPGQELIKPVGSVPEQPDLVVTMDVNSRERLGGLAPLLDTATANLVIDHHASNTLFGTANYVVYTSDLSEEYVDFNASEYNAAVHAKRQKGLA